MTFRELLDKYRAGQASEEERAMVEAELEKSEAIADYLAEQVEDALGAAETQAPAGEVRHIQKKVNRRLRRHLQPRLHPHPRRLYPDALPHLWLQQHRRRRQLY